MPKHLFYSKVEDDSLTSQNDFIKAVLFDVFGTVVDWRGSMVKEFSELFDQKEITNINCEEFVEKWVNTYAENMRKISEGTSAFALVDELNRIALNNILREYHLFDVLTCDEREHMWLIWHWLTPWPDSVSGINALKKQFKVGTLSNGNIRLLEDLSNNAKLEWDVILSGELFHCYKPNPMVYQMAAKELGIEPSEILLVASHKYDLEAARQCGYKTAYIFRPLECQTIEEEQIPKEYEFDFVIESLNDLAEKLSPMSADLSCMPSL